MENAMKLDKNWYIWLISVHFLGHPVWWKNTLNKYIYVIGNEGPPKAQPHKEKLFLKSNYNAKCNISKFLAHFMAFSIFFGHPIWSKYTWNKFICIFGTKGSIKAPPHKGKLFGRATILIDVIYLNFKPISWYFPFFRTPCMVKIDLE